MIIDVEKLAIENKPKLIIAGGSAYSRVIDFKRFRNICDKVRMPIFSRYGSFFWFSWQEGFIPILTKYADVVTSTTHKVLRGPRGGIILTNKEELIKNLIVLFFQVYKEVH